MHPLLQQLSAKFRHLLHSEGLFSFLLILALICLLAVTIQSFPKPILYKNSLAVYTCALCK